MNFGVIGPESRDYSTFKDIVKFAELEPNLMIWISTVERSLFSLYKLYLYIIEQCLTLLYIIPAMVVRRMIELLCGFSAGFNSVFPMEKLFPFSPSELQMILCGDQAPEWTREDVLNYTEPKLGYSRER